MPFMVIACTGAGPENDDSIRQYTISGRMVALAVIGAAILLFGFVAAAAPGSSNLPFLRAIGVASIGMGIFGLLITVAAYRRRERWAWFT